MQFDDNRYTSLLAHYTSLLTKSLDDKNQVVFLVGDNLIFGDALDFEDPRLSMTELEKGDSVFFFGVSKLLDQRGEDINESFSDEEKKKLEPVYIYLENVVIHSTANNKTTHIKEFALRISSIDGIFAGSPENLPK